VPASGEIGDAGEHLPADSQVDQRRRAHFSSAPLMVGHGDCPSFDATKAAFFDL
jgi:hypothetical protein